jgi:hypothetical protein
MGSFILDEEQEYIQRKQKICDLDELILEWTFYSWTEVFLKVDQLS